jgi:hypothetical protein
MTIPIYLIVALSIIGLLFGAMLIIEDEDGARP